MNTNQAQSRFPTFLRAWTGLLHMDLVGRLFFLAALTGLLTILSADGLSDGDAITIALGMICSALIISASAIHICERYQRVSR